MASSEKQDGGTNTTRVANPKKGEMPLRKTQIYKKETKCFDRLANTFITFIIYRNCMV